MDSLLFEGEIVLEKMNMKGGWTYALLPPVMKGGKKNFGWAKVNAEIDGYALSNVSLMPIKGGRLFLAVKAAIRKEIKKEAGDTVYIKLYGQKQPDLVAEQDFYDALGDDPTAQERFNALPAKERKAYLAWIFEDGDSEVTIGRIASAIDDIALGKLCKQAGKKKG